MKYIAGALVGILLTLGYAYEQKQNQRITNIENFLSQVTAGR
jgi:hypothetical protein